MAGYYEFYNEPSLAKQLLVSHELLHGVTQSLRHVWSQKPRQRHNYNVRLKIPTASSLKMPVFRDVTSCDLGACCLHQQGDICVLKPVFLSEITKEPYKVNMLCV